MDTATSTQATTTELYADANVRIVDTGERQRVGHDNSRDLRVLTLERGAEQYTIYATDHPTYLEPCGTCDGGSKPWHMNVANGVCFQCGGNGTTTKSWGSLERLAATYHARALARARYAKKREQERQERHEANRAQREAEEAQEAADEAARQAKLAAIDYLGQPGDRVELTGTVKVAMTVDGYAYGSTQMLLIIEGDGYVAKTYTSAAFAYELERGQQVRLAATVKKHATGRDGERLTVLTRPKQLS